MEFDKSRAEQLMARVGTVPTDDMDAWAVRTAAIIGVIVLSVDIEEYAEHVQSVLENLFLMMPPELSMAAAQNAYLAMETLRRMN